MLSPITRAGIFFRLKAFLGYPAYIIAERRSSEMSASELLRYQENSIRSLLKEAIKNVKYYREREDLYSLPLKARNGDEFWFEFNKLPLLEKAVIRRNVSEFRNQKKRLLVSSHTTTGSTGVPITIYASLMERAYTNAAVHRYFVSITSRLNPRVLYLSGMSKKVDAVCSFSSLTGDGSISIYDLQKENAGVILDFLKKNKFDLVYGYPSAIYELAMLLDKSARGGSFIPKGVVCTAETLHPHWAAEIKRVLRCPVYNFYGSQEGSHLAYTEACGHMHLNPHVGILEESTEGALVTGFVRKAMPLIRYKLGDVVSVSHSNCAKYPAPVISEIGGRSDERIVTRSGSRIGFFRNHIAHFLNGVEEFQLVQKDFDRFVINAVASENRNVDSEGIASEFSKRLGYKVTVVVNFVESLPRSKRGKFRPVIVDVPDDGQGTPVTGR